MISAPNFYDDFHRPPIRIEKKLMTLRIEDYALIGNMHTAALVGIDGRCGLALDLTRLRRGRPYPFTAFPAI